MDQLPLWFLIASLFVPRVCLVIGYFVGELRPFHLAGLLPPTMALLLPRVLILILIFQDRGWSGWLLLHGFALWMVYVGTGTAKKR